MHPETGIHTRQVMAGLQARSRVCSEHQPPLRAHGAAPGARFLVSAPHTRGAQYTQPPVRHAAWRVSEPGRWYADFRRTLRTSPSPLRAATSAVLDELEIAPFC